MSEQLFLSPERLRVKTPEAFQVKTNGFHHYIVFFPEAVYLIDWVFTSPVGYSPLEGHPQFEDTQPDDMIIEHSDTASELSGFWNWLVMCYGTKEEQTRRNLSKCAKIKVPLREVCLRVFVYLTGPPPHPEGTHSSEAIQRMIKTARRFIDKVNKYACPN